MTQRGEDFLFIVSPSWGVAKLTFEPKKADTVAITKGVRSGVPRPPPGRLGKQRCPVWGPGCQEGLHRLRSEVTPARN